MNFEIFQPTRMRIIAHLRERKLFETIPADLAKSLGLHYNVLKHHLNKLEEFGCVIIRNHGRIRVISLNNENPFMKSLLEFLEKQDLFPENQLLEDFAGNTEL